MTCTYTLSRRLPDGTVKRHIPQYTMRNTAAVASYVLYDNRLASKADAQRFAAQLSKAPRGEWLTHEPSGYAFKIDAS